LLLGVVLLAGCREAALPAPVPGARTEPAPELETVIYRGGLKAPWQDFGWATREAREPGGPERLLFAGYGGWILANPGARLVPGGLAFRVKVEGASPDVLQVRVDSEQADVFPRVMIEPRHRRDLPDGWSEVFVPMRDLNPELHAFDRVIVRAAKKLPVPGRVLLDELGFTKADEAITREAEAQLAAPGLPASFTVDCTAKPKPISPYIYGIAFSPRHEFTQDVQWRVRATARRWGGNPTSRYNWELGNAWNTASDYFFMNVNYTGKKDYSWEEFLDTNRDRGLASVLTLPTLGWVAKDTKSVAFPVSEFGRQAAEDPDGKGAGNGVGRDGRPLDPQAPGRTSVAASPEFIGRWVKAVQQHEAKRGRSVELYILDNEPGLWHDTHRDVHPKPLTYDELFERTVKYATAVREAAPDALIAGPAEWGWTGYFYSAADQAAGLRKRPDRKAHGDAPLIEWWLDQVAAHQKKTGTRLLDVLDLHFYPQGPNLGVGTQGATDRDTNALRLRSTRALWDPHYVDESWIKEPVRLIPRMREWAKRVSPELKLALGEYNFGAEEHLSGGLALAEALGRFGQEELWAAFYWTVPPENSPAYWAFKAFRDYDGKGAAFLDWGLPTTASHEGSLFAARSADGRKLTLVALNRSPDDTLEVNLRLDGCPVADAQRVFLYTGDPRGFAERPVPVGRPYRLPPYSISVVELALPSAPGP
jgi:hypothetical protein